MTCSTQYTQYDLAMELLIEHGFEGIAESIAILMKSAMQPERSRHEVSRAGKLPDEQLSAWRNRPLEASPYVYLDARYEKVRYGGVVLIAVGVDATGNRQVLGTSVKLTEHEVHYDCWSSFWKIEDQDESICKWISFSLFTRSPVGDAFPSSSLSGSVLVGEVVKTARHEHRRLGLDSFARQRYA